MIKLVGVPLVMFWEDGRGAKPTAIDQQLIVELNRLRASQTYLFQSVAVFDKLNEEQTLKTLIRC